MRRQHTQTDLLKREDQWKAFHHWEVRQRPAPTVVERVRWYNEAFLFARSHEAKQSREDLMARVGCIAEVRQRLAALSPASNNG